MADNTPPNSFWPALGDPSQTQGYNPMVAALLGIGQGFSRAAQPSPFPVTNQMMLGDALQGGAQGLGNAAMLSQQQQMYQMQMQKAQADNAVSQVNAARAMRSYGLGNQLLGLGGPTPAGAMPQGGGSVAPQGGGAPMPQGGAPIPQGAGGPSPAMGGSSMPQAGGAPAAPGPQDVLATIASSNDPGKLYAAAARIYAVGDPELAKIADMAKTRADTLTTSMVSNGITWGDDGKPQIAPGFAQILAAKKAAETAGTNQQNITLGQGPQGVTIAGLSQAPGSVQGIQQRAFAQGYGDQSGKDTSTLQTAGPIENSKAVGTLYGQNGLPMPSGANIQAPPVTMGGAQPPTQMPQIQPGPSVQAPPVTTPQGPSAIPVPTVGNAAPAAAPAAPPMQAPAVPPQLTEAMSAIQQAKAPPSYKTFFDPNSGQAQTIDVAHQPVPPGYIDASEASLPPGIRGQAMADTELRKLASTQQAEIGRQSNVLDSALALQNDPSFKSGKWADLSLDARAFLAPFGFDQNTVNSQQAYQSALARLTFQEAPTLNVKTVRPQMLGIMREVQGELGQNPNANKAAVLIGKSMAQWDLGRIAAITGSPNATKAEGDYIANTPVMTPELKTAVQNTLHSDQFTVPKFTGQSAPDQAMAWYQQFSPYWSQQQKQSFYTVMQNLGKGMDVTGKSFKIGAP